MPMRQGGILASRASTWPRDHFCRSTMAPRALWPATWNEFLPISMPITAIRSIGCPGTLVARHTHPGIESGYVVSGGLELPIEGQPTRMLKPGDGFHVPVATPH